MKRILKKYIVPHEGNNHTPHLLRTAGAAGLLTVIVAIFGITLGQTLLLKQNNFASVVTPVLVDLTNADRQTQHLPSLTINPLLVKAAQMKSNDMAAKGYFAHVTPEGYSPWHWFDLVGYNFLYAGENLAVNYTESSDVETAWMNSPGHRSNILNQNFTEIGIATQSGMYQGQSAIFVTQLFGQPMPAAFVSALKKANISTQKNIIAQKPKLIGQVKSEATSSVPAEMFLAAQSIATTTSSSIQSTPLAGTTETVHYGNALSKVLGQPRTILAYAYVILGAVILLVMGLIILGEYKHHHIRNVSYGAGLLATMIVLMYILSAFIPHVIVV